MEQGLSYSIASFSIAHAMTYGICMENLRQILVVLITITYMHTTCACHPGSGASIMFVTMNCSVLMSLQLPPSTRPEPTSALYNDPQPFSFYIVLHEV